MRRNLSSSHFSRNRSSGFTLVELMFTLALAAVLLAIGIPSFRGMMATNRLVTQTNEFNSAVNFARSEAITRNSTVTLCRAENEAATDCETDDDPWTAWIVQNAAGDVLRRGVVNTYGDTIVVSSDLADQSVSFTSDGLARTGGALISDSSFFICSTQAADQNWRTVTIGAGSRLSTVKTQEPCP
jgi:type IV fimbrial biogenesis protein FimT